MTCVDDEMLHVVGIGRGRGRGLKVDESGHIYCTLHIYIWQHKIHCMSWGI